MSERAELVIHFEANSETTAALAEYGHVDLTITVKGVLRQRALEWWKETSTDTPDVYKLGTIVGTPLFILANQEANAGRVGAIALDGFEYSGTKLVLDARATFDESQLSFPVLGAPQVEWGADVFGLLKTQVFSPDASSDDVFLALDGGPWQVWMLEWDADTVEVDIERSS